MNSTSRLFLEFIICVLKEFVLWIFVGLDVIGLILQYAPMIIPGFRSILIPSFVYWALPIVGFIWASFRVYSSARVRDDPRIRQLERDRELFNELVEVLPSTGSINWLRDYDFGSAFDLDWLRDIHSYIERCRHPEFEFIDQELEGLKLDLLRRCEEFMQVIALETFPVKMPNRLLNSIPQEMSYQDPQRFQSIRKRINDAADEVVEAYDNLVRRARRKL